ncbi:hypothetical protein EXIGLDRAFT_791707 [Exidia glandulosa HHB12029]|uniref:Transmembrane protein 242 n=1 Tax=Exidia glandulosa HHB12029 TaxID=1314781 RepID=A0A165NVB1_EXIGL|nr:hypothetical protein EXIGLDRAFT_791707 [Exidia glandulosa HHB12029]
MADRPEDPEPPRQLPKVVLGLAVVRCSWNAFSVCTWLTCDLQVAVVGPLFLLRRLHARSTRLELEVPPPPVRRGVGRVSVTSAPVQTSPSSSGGGSFGFAGEDDEDWGVRPPPQQGGEEGSQLDNALFAFKAIGIATGIVCASGAGLFFGAKTLLGVRDTEEFAHKMRSMLPRAMPTLNERMDTSLKTDASTPVQDTTDTEWTWAGAQSRLAEAYDEGGASRWTEQLAREAEAEARLELAKRERRAQQLSKQTRIEGSPP